MPEPLAQYACDLSRERIADHEKIAGGCFEAGARQQIAAGRPVHQSHRDSDAIAHRLETAFDQCSGANRSRDAVRLQIGVTEGQHAVA